MELPYVALSRKLTFQPLLILIPSYPCQSRQHPYSKHGHPLAREADL